MFYAQVGAEWTDMSGELKAPIECDSKYTCTCSPASATCMSGFTGLFWFGNVVLVVSVVVSSMSSAWSMMALANPLSPVTALACKRACICLSLAPTLPGIAERIMRILSYVAAGVLRCRSPGNRM